MNITIEYNFNSNGDYRELTESELRIVKMHELIKKKYPKLHSEYSFSKWLL